MRISDWSSDVCSSDLLGLKDGCALIDAWGEPPRPFGPQMLAGMAEQRCNDACVDSAGRFWIGSVTSDKANPAATLYRLDPDGSLRTIFGGLLTSNRAAFSPAGPTFYHADTPPPPPPPYHASPPTGP